MIKSAYSLDALEEDIKRGNRQTATPLPSAQFIPPSPPIDKRETTAAKATPPLKIDTVDEEAPETETSAPLQDDIIQRLASLRKEPEGTKAPPAATDEEKSNPYDRSRLKKVSDPTSRGGGSSPKKPAKKLPSKGSSSVDEKFPEIDVKYVGGTRVVKNVPGTK